jgi:hypothetical protein
MSETYFEQDKKRHYMERITYLLIGAISIFFSIAWIIYDYSNFSSYPSWKLLFFLCVIILWLVIGVSFIIIYFKITQRFKITDEGIFPFKKPISHLFKKEYLIPWENILYVVFVEKDLTLKLPVFHMIYKDMKKETKYRVDSIYVYPKVHSETILLKDIDMVKERLLSFSKGSEFNSWLKEKKIKWNIISWDDNSMRGYENIGGPW